VSKKPNVLIFDIETAPIIAHVWALWGEQNIGLNQIAKDWHIMSWSAKWFEAKDGTVYGPHNKIMYMDQRNAKAIEDDTKILKGIWELLNMADVVITQNGDAFDIKKLNARFILNGFKPPSSYKRIDTKKIAKAKFGFTSNRLDYMSDKINKKYKKQKHSKFAGHEMWTECLAGNIKAWKEMEKYNKYDVLALEELYIKFQPWDNSFNPNLYTDNLELVCACGSNNFIKNGHAYTSTGKYQRYSCGECGAESKDRVNLFSKEKKKSLRAKT
jgi:hypothetical protein